MKIAHVYYTEDVVSSSDQRLEVYENIEIVYIDIQDCIRQIRSNEIQDSELIYAVLQLMLRGYLKDEDYAL